MSLMETHKANPYHVVKDSGIAPLHFAVCMTNEKSAIYFTKFFLKHSGDPNVKTEDGETSLHIACYYGRMKIVELLVINGGDISIKDNDGNTPLNITINEGHFDIFEMLKKMIFEAKEKKRNETVPETEIDDPDKPARLTLNRLRYDMDSASPYYVNITRRKPKPTVQPINHQEASIVEEQANIFQLNESNLVEFQKVNQRLSKKSLVHTWKEKLINTATNYDEMLQEFNNLQFSSTKLSDDLEFDLTNEMTNKFSSNIKSSSTKLPLELAVDVDAANDSFYTARSGENGTFIKSPNRLGNDEENSPENQVQLVEDYRHNDRENGVVFYERKIEPCLSRTNKTDSQTSASSKFTVPSDYNTADLRRELTQFGDSPGPITKSTKYLYMKRLMKFKRHPELANVPSNVQSKSNYSIELEKTLKPDTWQDALNQYAEMDFETKMVNGFQTPQFLKSNGDDCLKKSFVYILIDPIISENLPGNAKNLEPLEAWKRFISSIFYIGKGTCSRPYSHLYDAIKMYQQRSGKSEPNSDSPWTKKVKETEKLKRINNIWKADKGVICLNVFHNITGAEAFCREACIIEAIGLENVTNLKRGEYHGLPKTWPMRDRKQLGVVLLFKSFKIYLSEGESQLRPNHIKS
ncbi:hypothetical protein HA402_000492 [Bradysia odoriphaga]|nr:hypothetical protein HA402_000492 [Bradysia odoriphaga]